MAVPHVCPKCDGTKVVGENFPQDDDKVPCPTCGGEGVVWDRQGRPSCPICPAPDPVPYYPLYPCYPAAPYWWVDPDLAPSPWYYGYPMCPSPYYIATDTCPSHWSTTDAPAEVTC